MTVILSTHIVDDVRELCPRMAIISNGELLVEGASAEALESLRGKIWSRMVATDDELRALETAFNVISTHLIGGLHEVRVYAESSPGEGFRRVDSCARRCLLAEPRPPGEELIRQKETCEMTMFWEFFTFELKFRFKSVSTYVYFAVWFAFSFLDIAAENFGVIV